MPAIFFSLAILSEILGTLAGFGSSTVFLPLALLFVDFQTALVLVAFFHVFGNVVRLNFFKSGLDTHLLVRFGLPSVFLTVIGALFVSQLPQLVLKGLLGFFLVLFAVVSLAKRRLELRQTMFNVIVAGGLSGFLAGLIGTGGAVRGAALTAFGISKARYLATAAAVALAVDATRIPIYLSQGFLTTDYFWYIPGLLLTAMVGSYLGKKIVNRLPQEEFTKIVLGAIGLIGLIFVVDWL